MLKLFEVVKNMSTSKKSKNSSQNFLVSIFWNHYITKKELGFQNKILIIIYNSFHSPSFGEEQSEQKAILIVKNKKFKQAKRSPSPAGVKSG